MLKSIHNRHIRHYGHSGCMKTHLSYTQRRLDLQQVIRPNGYALIEIDAYAARRDVLTRQPVSFMEIESDFPRNYSYVKRTFTLVITPITHHLKLVLMFTIRKKYFKLSSMIP